MKLKNVALRSSLIFLSLFLTACASYEPRNQTPEERSSWEARFENWNVNEDGTIEPPLTNTPVILAQDPAFAVRELETGPQPLLAALVASVALLTGVLAGTLMERGRR